MAAANTADGVAAKETMKAMKIARENVRVIKVVWRMDKPPIVHEESVLGDIKQKTPDCNRTAAGCTIGSLCNKGAHHRLDGDTYTAQRLKPYEKDIQLKMNRRIGL
jgi:hypothetical protein